MAKKLFSFLIAATLSMTICLSITPNYSIAQGTTSSKISLNLKNALYDLTNEETVPVSIWIEDIDYAKVEDTVLINTGTSDEQLLDIASELYAPLHDNSIIKIEEKYDEPNELICNEIAVAGKCSGDIPKEDINTLEKYKNFYKANKIEISELSSNVNTYISTKRAVAKEEYDKQNNEFVDDYLKNNDIIFVSSYAPMIIAELSKEDIYRLEKEDKVDSLYLHEKHENYDFGNIGISVPSIGGYYTRYSLGLDGEGVNIGQIENGRPKTGITELSSTTITRGGYDYNSDHASLVAAIIAGSTGMVPQAHLYSAGGIVDFYQSAEWLISSGVTVINCSNGSYYGDNYYDSAKWIDHVVNQHNVSWVQASGNDGANHVCSYGYSYNAITVGGINDNGTVDKTDDTYYESSAYNYYTTSFGMKPDVVAPAVGFSLSNGSYSGSGTSFAAPHVTGMIAQMMQFMPTVSLRPDAIKAAVLASCDRKVTDEYLVWITAQEGAGVINAIKAIDSITECNYYTTMASSITYTYSPQTTGFKKFVISWIKQNTNSGTNHSTIVDDPNVTNFDLIVYNSSGTIIASSLFTTNNAELVGFDAYSGSTYTIKIIRNNNFSSAEKISYAYYE